MKPKYNHAFTVAFSVDSNDPLGENITALEYTQALLGRICDLNEHQEWEEALGAPFDTYENQQEG